MASFCVRLSLVLPLTSQQYDSSPRPLFKVYMRKVCTACSARYSDGTELDRRHRFCTEPSEMEAFVCVYECTAIQPGDLRRLYTAHMFKLLAELTQAEHSTSDCSCICLSVFHDNLSSQIVNWIYSCILAQYSSYTVYVGGSLAGFDYALAQVQTFTAPGEKAITYSVNVPNSTAASGSGPIFIQMRSTKEVQWFAWGQGAMMQGANIFVVYATENNITVSPRLGVEHVMPLFNPQARLTILNGSRISNGTTTANIRCDSCITWPGGHEDVTSTSSPWIWAVKYGSMLDSRVWQPLT